MKISDTKAKNAMKTLREYCEEHRLCADCIFNNDEIGECKLALNDPFLWELEEDV